MSGGLPINKHLELSLLMLIVLTIVLPAFYLPNAEAQQSSWTSLTPMPTARGGLGVAVVSGKIYAIGGLSGGSPLNNNEKFDPVANEWTEEAPLPTARSGFAIAVYNNKIYVIGGTVGEGFVGNNEVYDPTTNSWETKASMPTPRGDLSASVVNDKIYLISGKKYSSSSPYFNETAVNEVYDPVNNTWSSASPITLAVYGYASTVIDGKIHIVGGSRNPASSGSSSFVASHQVYDPQTNNWTTASNLPSYAAYGAAASTTGFMAPSRLFFIGGYFSTAFTGANQMYNPQNDSWNSEKVMPTPRAYLGLAVVNDVLFAIGGFDGKNWLNTVERYTPVGYGTVPPQVQITSPENKTYSGVNLNFDVNRGTQWMGYSLDNQANVTIKGQTELYNLTQGAHSIIIFANDTQGNAGSSNRVFFSVDTLPPKIAIVLPQNQSYGSTDIELTFTVDEATKFLAYNLDGTGNVTIVGNVTLPALPNGSHKLVVYANDEVGNSGSQTVYFEIAPFPTILVVAAIVIVTIASAAGYLFYKHRKPNDKQKAAK